MKHHIVGLNNKVTVYEQINCQTQQMLKGTASWTQLYIHTVYWNGLNELFVFWQSEHHSFKKSFIKCMLKRVHCCVPGFLFTQTLELLSFLLISDANSRVLFMRILFNNFPSAHIPLKWIKF